MKKIIVSCIGVLSFLFILTGCEININGSTNNNDDNQNNSNTNEEVVKTYKTYKIGDEVTLSDNSKWIVLKNSDKNSDYVTLKAAFEYDVHEPDWSNLAADFTNYKTQYDNSSIKRYLESKISKIPASLKEVDGYKIRLVKLEEIFAIDDNWQYGDRDSYTYTGNDIENIKKYAGMTMDHTKCSDGEKCGAFYIFGQSQCYDNCKREYFFTDWAPGLGGISPVINVYKDSIESN